jgi:hypothetical protein
MAQNEASGGEERETHRLSNSQNKSFFTDSVEQPTAGAKKQLEHTNTVIMEEQEDLSDAQNKQSITRKLQIRFEKMLNAIGDSLSNLPNPDVEEDRYDKEDEVDTELGKLSDDDELGWVICTISKTVQHRMGSIWQKQIILDKLTQRGWGDVADYFYECDMKYGTVPAVGMPQTDTSATTITNDI